MAGPGETLLVGIGIDLPSLGRDTDAAVKYFKGFQRDVSKLITSARFAGDLSIPGRKAAASLLAGVKATFDDSSARLREDLARGIIDKRRFAIEGVKAAEEFNRSLASGMEQLEGKRLLPAGLRQSLSSEFKSIGKSSADLFAEQIQDRFQRFGSGLQSVGRGLTAGITAPVIAVGAAAFAAFSAVDEGLDTIRIGTGKTGTALSGLEADFRALFQTVPSSAADVAAALVAVNRQSGATGAQLQNIARAQLTFARLTKTDLNTALAESTQLFQQFGIAANDQVATLDFLFQVVQRSGGSLSGLSASLNKVGPTLRQFGFSFKQSAALAALFEKSGLDVVTTVNAMRTAMPKLVRASGDASTALSSLIQQIKSAKTDSQAIELTSKVFGRGGASTFVAAVREGRLAYGELLAAVAQTPDSLSRAASATDDFGERLQKLRNRAAVALEPLGKKLVDSFERAQPSFVRMIESVSSVVDAFSRLSPATQDFIIKAALIGAALGPALSAVGGLVTAVGPLVPALINGAKYIAGLRVVALALGAVLTPGGLIVAGLAVLAAALYKAGAAARQAKEDHEAYKAALAGVVDESALFTQIGELRKGLAGAIKERERLLALEASTGKRFVKVTDEATGKTTFIDLSKAINAAAAQVTLYRDRLEDTRQQYDKVAAASRAVREEAEKTAAAIAGALGGSGSTAGVVNFDSTGAAKALDALKSRAEALKAAYEDIRKGAAPIPELTPALLATYDHANKLLDAQADKFGAVGKKLQEIIRSLVDTELVEVMRKGKKLDVEVTPLIKQGKLTAPIKMEAPNLRLPKIQLERADQVNVTALQSTVQEIAGFLARASLSVERFASTTGAGHGVVTKFLQELSKGSGGAARAFAELSLRLPRALSIAADGVTLFARATVSAASATVSTFKSIGRGLLDAINPVVIVGQFFADAFGGLGDVFAKLKGPLSALSKILAEALAPIVDALIPVFRAILPVLRAFLQVLTPIITALVPVLQALVPLLEAVFPIIKAVAIAFTYLAQAALTVGAVILDVFGFIARGFGEIVKGIAKAIDKLPGVSAKGAIKAGEAIIQFGRGLNKSADEFRKSAKAMEEARRQIRATTIGGPIEESADETADSLDVLGDAARDTTAALLNIPQGFKVERLRFRTAMAELVKSIAATPVQVPVPVPKVPDVRPVPKGGGGAGTGTTTEDRTRSPVTLSFGAVTITTPSADGRTVYRAFFDEVTRLARQAGEEAQQAVLALPRPA